MNKNNRFLSGALAVFVSVFGVVGVSYAATSLIDAKGRLGGEDGDFFDFRNTTIEVGSLKVGSQGSGGVTFFNGTIVNNTTDSFGADAPITISDNLRVDGAIQRGHNRSDDAWDVKIDDGLRVYGDAYFERDLNSLGSSHISGNIRVDGQIQRGHNLPSDQWGVEINDDLAVFGDLEVQGEVRVSGITKKLVIPAAAYHVLRQSSNVQLYDGTGGEVYNASTLSPAFVGAPVYLPEGAVIKSATAYYEQIASDDFTVQLRRYDLLGNTDGVVFQNTTTAGQTSMSLSVNDVYSTIDVDHQYFIYIGLPEYNAGQGDASKMKGLVIEYEVVSL